MQLRENVTLGNIYSTLVADMYNKVLKILGYTSYFPLVINVNGKKTENLLRDLSIDISNTDEVKKCVSSIIMSIRDEYQNFGINFESLILDDQVYFDGFGYKTKKITVKSCSKCKTNFGTDPSLFQCQLCGSSLIEDNEERLCVDVQKHILLKFLEGVSFYPQSKVISMGKIIESFPETCTFCLEKERTLTLYHNNKPLDPKLLAVQSLVTAFINSHFTDPEIDFFQGDVLKKFTYYSLAYLPEKFVPKRVVCHGLILGPDGKKMRADVFSKDLLNSLSSKLLRGFLLSCQIGANIKFSKALYDNKSVGLIRIINKVRTLIHYSDSDQKPTLFLRNEFLSSIMNLDYARAYEYFLSLVNHYWLMTRSEKMLSPQDKVWIKEVSNLYFIQI